MKRFWTYPFSRCLRRGSSGCELRKPRSIWCGTALESEYMTETLAAGHAKYPVNLEITFEIGLFANDLNDLTPTAAQFVQASRMTSPWISLEDSGV